MPDIEVTRLGRMIAKLQQQAATSHTTPQLSNSSIVDGTLDVVALVDTGETDADGDPVLAEVVQAQLGSQEDGSQTLVVLDGPEPPVPAGVSATGSLGVITVGWDGTFEGGAAATLDHDHVAVHLARKADVDAATVIFPSDATNVGSIRSLLGGLVSVGVDPGVAYYAALVEVTQASKWSGLSTVVEAVASSILDDTELAALLASKARIYLQDAEPAAPVPAGSWWATVGTPRRLSYTAAGATAGPAVWEQRTFDADQTITAGTVVASLIAAGAVTAGKIAAGAVEADAIAADAIVARHIAVGAVSADKISAGLLSALVTITGGLKVVAPNGDVGTELVPGASVLRGAASLDNATVDTLKLNTSGRVGKAAVVTLEAGVTGPGVGPAVESFVPVSLTLKDGAGAVIAPLAVCRNAITAGDCWWSLTADSSGVVTARTHALATGAQTEETVLAVLPGTYLSSLYGRGGTVTLLRKSGGTLYADDYLGGDPLSTQSLGSNWEMAGDPFLGMTDIDPVYGAFPVIGYKSSATNREVFKRYDEGFDTSPSSTISNATVSADTPATPKGILATTGDWGARRHLFGHASFFRATTDAGAVQASADFAAASGSTVGVGYDASGFWSADSAGNIFRHTGQTWTDTGATKVHDFAVSYTNGANESGVSPRRSVAIGKRAHVRVSLPGWAADATVTALRFYSATVGGTLYRVGQVTVNSLTAATIPLAAGTTPVTNSPFPSSTPASLASADGATVIRGDGTMKLQGTEWAKGAAVTFATTAGQGAAGSGWYRDYGPFGEWFWESSGDIGAGNQVALPGIVPAALRPLRVIPLACGGGVYGDRAANGEMRVDGNVYIRNNHSAAVAVQAYGFYRRD